MRPLQQQTWESFSIDWHTDVKISCHWLRQALLAPLRPGSRVVVVSSGVALAGSPLSGGYAGAKATQRFLTAYAQQEYLQPQDGPLTPEQTGQAVLELVTGDVGWVGVPLRYRRHLEAGTMIGGHGC